MAAGWGTIRTFACHTSRSINWQVKDKVIASELEIPGSYGVQAQRYPVLIGMIENGIAASRKTRQKHNQP